MLFSCVLQQELIEKCIMQQLKKGLNYCAVYVFRLQIHFFPCLLSNPVNKRLWFIGQSTTPIASALLCIPVIPINELC